MTYVQRSVHGICLIYVVYVHYTWFILGVCCIHLTYLVYVEYAW